MCYNWVEVLTVTKFEKGSIVKGTVTGIESYGVFLTFDNYYSGLIHISHGFVKNITDFVNIGDIIYVKILEVDEETSHLKLSIKDIPYKKGYHRKRKIQETSLGFKTLAYKLPIWIEENLKKSKN